MKRFTVLVLKYFEINLKYFIISQAPEKIVTFVCRRKVDFIWDYQGTVFFYFSRDWNFDKKGNGKIEEKWKSEENFFYHFFFSASRKT